MQRSGRVSPDLDPDDVGRALLAGIQGGVSIMLATGDSAHLESALDVVASRAARKQLDLAYAACPGLPYTIIGDGG